MPGGCSYGDQTGIVELRGSVPRCVLLSGAIGVGKSAIARRLESRHSFQVVSVRNALAEILSIDPNDRTRLQERGADLDRRTSGRWLYEYLAYRLESTRVVVDSMRTRRQTVPVLELVEGSFLVYLDARVGTRQERFQLSAREDLAKRSLSFAEAMRHPTETEVVALRAMSQLVIETDGLTVDEVVAEITAAIGL